MKYCYLFGNWDTPYDIQAEIEKAVERRYLEYGIRQFYMGSYGAFDSMAASAVKAVKKKYGGISLYLVIPYHLTQRPISLPMDLMARYILTVWSLCRTSSPLFRPIGLWSKVRTVLSAMQSTLETPGNCLPWR